MSEGPIKRERDAWKPIRVSTPDNARVCMISDTPGVGYCGRTSAKTRASLWADVNCWDCSAAWAADLAARVPA